MLKGRKTRKAAAAFLLIIFFTSTAAPTAAYALTSGPTAPEATSFEPVDTTDMVNTLTGDLTYNVPLLEVPGPEGGYPLSLAYHAGIQPNEDASWVGLGWSLGPGAINRNTNGYPDDFDGVSYTNRFYWGGGNTKTFGVNVPITSSPSGPSFGLNFSNDTYRGFSVGMDFDLFSVGNFTTSLSVDPYADRPSIGFSAKSDALLPISNKIGVETNFKSISFTGNTSVLII